MEIALTLKLLRFLMDKGFRYCLCKMEEMPGQRPPICITLKPVVLPPLSPKVTSGFDDYYMIENEPAWLANGIEGVRVNIDVDKRDLIAYVSTQLGKLGGGVI